MGGPGGAGAPAAPPRAPREGTDRGQTDRRTDGQTEAAARERRSAPRSQAGPNRSARLPPGPGLLLFPRPTPLPSAPLPGAAHPCGMRAGRPCRALWRLRAAPPPPTLGRRTRRRRRRKRMERHCACAGPAPAPARPGRCWPMAARGRYITPALRGRRWREPPLRAAQSRGRGAHGAAGSRPGAGGFPRQQPERVAEAATPDPGDPRWAGSSPGAHRDQPGHAALPRPVPGSAAPACGAAAPAGCDSAALGLPGGPTPSRIPMRLAYGRGLKIAPVPAKS